MTPADLKQFMADHGLTQREAAALLHVHQKTVQGWLYGYSEMPWMAAELLKRLAAER